MTDAVVSTDRWKRRTTRVGCFLHFDFSFMVWILLGALEIPLAAAAHLSAAQKGFVVAVPILAGSLLRIPVGIGADRSGGRRARAGRLGRRGLPAPAGLAARQVVGRGVRGGGEVTP